jgi:hypothetical protein
LEYLDPQRFGNLFVNGKNGGWKWERAASDPPTVLSVRAEWLKCIEQDRISDRPGRELLDAIAVYLNAGSRERCLGPCKAEGLPEVFYGYKYSEYPQLMQCSSEKVVKDNWMRISGNK